VVPGLFRGDGGFLNPTWKKIYISSTVLDSKAKHFFMFWFLKPVIPILMIALVHMGSSCLRKAKNTFVFLKDFLNIFEGVIF